MRTEIKLLTSFQCSAAFTPSFAEPVPNVTVVAGKDAVLPCIVDNLEHFKVRVLHCITIIRDLNEIIYNHFD